MSRQGRKRKLAYREPNGQIRRPTAAMMADMERRKLQEQMAVVLAQPHRKNSTDQKRGSAIGRFVMDRRMKPATFDAAEEYGALVRRWRAARGVPSELRDGPGGIGSGGPADATVRGWAARIEAIEAAVIAKSSARYLSAIRRLVLEDRDIDPADHYGTVLALMALAVETGWMSANEHPFMPLGR
jgi:hypothetical protein